MDFQIAEFVSKETQIAKHQVDQTIRLFEEGATIPFIARYRKERTGSLDETQIRSIEQAVQAYKDIVARKGYISKIIQEQGKWTDTIEKQITSTWDMQQLEDIYFPFKKKRRTKATVAREQGLEKLANIILHQRTMSLDQDAQKFLRGEVKTIADALEGARYIVAEVMNESIQVRNQLRKLFRRTAMIHAKVYKTKKEAAAQYQDYFEYSEALKQIPSHRLLAIRRGEEERLLKVSIDIDAEQAIQIIKAVFIKKQSTTREQLQMAAEDAWKRLLSPSLENEFAKLSKEKADHEAIEVFTSNLKQLLLEAPVGQRATLAIDPGFRTGCKVVVLDDQGMYVEDTVIYPHPPQNNIQGAIQKIRTLLQRYPIEVIAIGNGTAGRETKEFIQNIKDIPSDIEVFLISESGASIYSASPIAKEEFPNLDITVRGAISIGRRLMDPLAELVKIDPKSIGVGQYQYDVDQLLLKKALDHQVLSCVNQVGININTASFKLLSYVSGIGEKLAQNIVAYRQEKGAFTTKEELKKVKGLGEKAFQLAAGFLRIKNGPVALDNTGIHPERYQFVEQILKKHQMTIPALLGKSDVVDSISWQTYQSDEVGKETINDVIEELKKPGLDPRGKAQPFHFASIQSIEELKEQEVLPGIVTNITKFGAFVDIGLKENGLVHVSEMANRFIKDPAEILKLGDRIQVRVISVDLKRKRIQLSIKQV